MLSNAISDFFLFLRAKNFRRLTAYYHVLKKKKCHSRGKGAYDFGYNRTNRSGLTWFKELSVWLNR